MYVWDPRSFQGFFVLQWERRARMWSSAPQLRVKVGARVRAKAGGIFFVGSGCMRCNNMVTVRFSLSLLVVVDSTEIAKSLAIGTTAVEYVVVAFGIEV